MVISLVSCVDWDLYVAYDEIFINELVDNNLGIMFLVYALMG